MKFKIGDKVKIIRVHSTNIFYSKHINEICKVTNISDTGLNLLCSDNRIRLYYLHEVELVNTKKSKLPSWF